METRVASGGFYVRVFYADHWSDLELMFHDKNEAEDAIKYIMDYFPELRFEVISEAEKTLRR